MSCPVTLAYLKEIGRMLEGYDQMRIIYGTVIEHVEGLQERAEATSGTLECQRLRAFWCVEMMYSSLIRRALDKDKILTRYAGQHVRLDPKVQQLTVVTPRSWEGLGVVVENIESLRSELSIQLTEIAFAKKSKFGASEEAMLEDRFKTTLAVFEISTEAVKRLRRALGNQAVQLKPIGSAFAIVVDMLQIPHRERVNFGITLLNISPDNPESPCQIPSQE